ncbi:acyltransferase [Fulvivirga sp. 29W222]|uniref:Acyltransferase n=1 Tax=Fulvivirga marina TaxID=2494733 RepID=A0A937G130_9BACT|nr:acyltransferase [Fulvivirga marina]MBL6449860.1 acyltransferase [Fulvivirga marina]
MKKLFGFILRVHDFIYRKLSYLKLKTLIREVGENTSGNWTVEIKYGQNIKIGAHTTIGPYSTLGAMSPIVIGNFVRISKGVILETAGLNLNAPPPYKHQSKPITIEDGVWLATNVIVLGGVTIGENSIIGAGVVVTKNVAPNSVVVGQSMRLLDKKITR